MKLGWKTIAQAGFLPFPLRNSAFAASAPILA
jgi:hypothetical protein